MRQNRIKRWTPITSWDEVPQVMGVTDLCTVLRISKPIALRYLNNGEIPATKAGREWRIDKDAVREYLTGRAAGDRLYSESRCGRLTEPRYDPNGKEASA